MKKKIGFVSLGCAKNLTDTETMLALLKNENYIITPDADDAEIIVVNTCAFIDSAKEESINAIIEMAQKKEEKLSFPKSSIFPSASILHLTQFTELIIK